MLSNKTQNHAIFVQNLNTNTVNMNPPSMPPAVNKSLLKAMMNVSLEDNKEQKPSDEEMKSGDNVATDESICDKGE